MTYNSVNYLFLMNQVSPIEITNQGFIIKTQKITLPVFVPEHISLLHRQVLKNSKKFNDYIQRIVQAPKDIEINRMQVISLQIFTGNRMGFATLKIYGSQLTNKGLVNFEDYVFIQGGSVGIMVFVNDKLAVVNQYRVPKQKMCIQPPAGMLDQSGDLKSKVLEQLEQQTNIIIKKQDLVYMGSMNPNLAISDEQFYLYYCKINLSPEKMKQIQEKTHGQVNSLQKIRVKFIDYDPQVILDSGNSSFITMAAFYETLIRGKNQSEKSSHHAIL